MNMGFGQVIKAAEQLHVIVGQVHAPVGRVGWFSYGGVRRCLIAGADASGHGSLWPMVARFARNHAHHGMIMRSGNARHSARVDARDRLRWTQVRVNRRTGVSYRGDTTLTYMPAITGEPMLGASQ